MCVRECVWFNCQRITEQATVSNFMSWNVLDLLTPDPASNSNLQGRRSGYGGLRLALLSPRQLNN